MCAIGIAMAGKAMVLLDVASEDVQTWWLTYQRSGQRQADGADARSSP